MHIRDYKMQIVLSAPLTNILRIEQVFEPILENLFDDLSEELRGIIQVSIGDSTDERAASKQDQ